jgi:predicted kinase
MLSLNEFIDNQRFEEICEALITFGGKAYPKFNNIVIMAGGAGSGKGFVLSNLVGIEGYKFDVDELKTLASKSEAIQKRVRSEFGVDIADLASKLKDPENVSKLHEIISSMGVDDRRTRLLYKSIAQGAADRKPNIIFDVTLKDLRKLEKLTRAVTVLGYDKKDIHIVWVVTELQMAHKQNLERDRVVPPEILVNTHRGVSQTMADIIEMGSTLKKYMDGDIVFAFNKFKVDSELTKSDKGGQYIKKSNYFYVKRRGMNPTSVDQLSTEVRNKLKEYTPKPQNW